MPDLRRAGEDIVDRPLFAPTPMAELEARAGRLVRQRRRRLAGLSVVAVVALVLALAGAVGLADTADRKGTLASGVPSETTPTTAAVVGDAAETTTTVAAAGATTTAAAAGSTATTARKSTATTAKKTSVAPLVASPSSKAVTGGITNVTASPTTMASADVQPGGAVTMLTAADIAGFDPATILNNSIDGLPAAAVFDMLFYVDSGFGTVVPQVAESLTSSDGVTWTLKVRPNVKFSDGTTYNAAAVKFNWERTALAGQIQAMDVIDAVTLRITLRSKYTTFPAAAGMVGFIGSPAAIQAKGAGFATDPVGAGPFILRSWQKGTQMTLARNPGYWNAPRPYIDSLVLRPVGDEAQRSASFSNSQANVAVVDSPQTADQLTKAGGSTPNKLVVNGGVAILFNTTKAPFNDVRARQAVALAVDVADYSKSVNGGLVDPIDSLFRHDSPFFDNAVMQQSFNPSKAQQLFDQVAADRGGPLSFTLTTSSAQTQTAAAQYVQAALNKYTNVKVTVQTESPAQHATNCSQGAFDGACTTVNGFDDPEPGWTALFRCNTSPSPTGWCNTKFDGAVVDNQQTLDPKQRVADIKTAQTEFYAEVPAFYLERRTQWIFTAPNVRDFRFANDGAPLIDRLWIQGRSSGTSGSTAPPQPPTSAATTSTARPATTWSTSVTTRPSTTTTTARKVTTTTVRPTATTAKPATPTTAAPATTTTAATEPTTTTVTAPPVTSGVALPAAATSDEPLPMGLLLIVVLLAIVFGIASCAAVMVWRQGRGW